MKTTLLALAALSLLACGTDGSETNVPAQQGALPPRILDGSATVSTDGATPTMDGGTPTSVVTIIDALPDAVDFDPRATDALVLRSGPSRVDACTSAGCSAFVTPERMPAESAERTNASLAITSDDSASSKFLVAQKGSAACDLDCTTDSALIPGLYYVLGDDHPRRLTATVPLVYAKAFRSTDGWLVGRGHAWAVDQRYNNEDFTKGRTSIYLSFGSTLSLTTLERSLLQAGPSHPILPFVFAQTTTNAGPLGYGNAFRGGDADFVDASANASATARSDARVVADTAAATTNVPTVIARSTVAKPGTVTTFDALTGRGAAEVAFPGIGPGDTLLATSDHVAYYASAHESVTLRACTRASLVGGQCQPMTIPLPLETVLRVRTRDDSVFVLGTSGGIPRLVRVVFGG